MSSAKPPRKSPKKPAKKSVSKYSNYICPKCRKGPIGIWMGGQVGMLYICNNCDYHGPLVLKEDARKSSRKTR